MLLERADACCNHRGGSTHVGFHFLADQLMLHVLSCCCFTEGICTDIAVAAVKGMLSMLPALVLQEVCTGHGCCCNALSG